MSKYTEPMKLINFVEQFVAHNTIVELYSLKLTPETINGMTYYKNTLINSKPLWIGK